MILDDSLMVEACGQLLMASTIDRYVEWADRLAAKSGLAAQADANAEVGLRILRRVDELRMRSYETNRPPEEFELAVLLCVMAQRKCHLALDMSGVVALRSPWLQGLALRLLPPLPLRTGATT
jgi:hypothetical protein